MNFKWRQELTTKRSRVHAGLPKMELLINGDMKSTPAILYFVCFVGDGAGGGEFNVTVKTLVSF